MWYYILVILSAYVTFVVFNNLEQYVMVAEIMISICGYDLR